MRHLARFRSPRSLTTAAAALIALTLMIAAAPTASAAPPGNDTIGNATAITTLPFSDTLDVSDATDDPENDCVTPEQTIWYTYTATEDLTVVFDTAGSDFETALSVYDGTPGTLAAACDDNDLGPYSQVAANLIAGHTYYVAVSRWTSGGGETVVLNAYEPPEQFTVQSTLTNATLTDSGWVELTFTVTCSGYAIAQFTGNVVQRHGHKLLTDIPFNLDDDDEYCGPTPTTWVAVAQNASSSPARRGKATITFRTRAFIGAVVNVFETQEVTVRLRKGTVALSRPIDGRPQILRRWC